MRTRTLQVVGGTAFGLLAVLGPAGGAHAASTLDVAITEPAPGSTETTRTPTFHGTGAADASVTVYDSQGYLMCAARVHGDQWSCESVRPMGDGRTLVFAEQNDHGGITRAQALFAVNTVDNSTTFPLTELLAGGIVLVLGLGAVTAATLYVRRQRRSSSLP